MQSPAARPQATRILVVDDQNDLANVISTFLTEEGYEVTICNDGREALLKIREINPAALVLDIMMPETDGFEVLRQLRLSDSGKRLPVVLMSAAWRSSEKHREIGTTFDIAPTLVLPKPFDLQDLDRSLRQMGIAPVMVAS